MRLFPRFRVIRTDRRLPGWLEAFRWTTTGLVFLAFAIVVLVWGYRIEAFGVLRWLMNALNPVVVIVTLVDVVLGFMFAPEFGPYIRRRWLDLTMLIPILAALVSGHSALLLIALRQFIVLGQSITYSRHFGRVIVDVRRQPLRLLAVSFIALIALGTLFLTFPAAASSGHATGLMDALFTSTSAVSTTGLVTVDTGSHYSVFGQVVIALLFQVGGLGYMVLIALIIYGVGGRLSLTGQVLLRESISTPSTLDLRKFALAVMASTFVIETAGAGLLALCFLGRMPFWTAVYSGAFHSVSAFCTAGFGLYSDSFTAYQNHLGVNLVLNLLSIAGAVGFSVLYDLARAARNRLAERTPRGKLSAHSRLVLTTGGLLVLIGTVTIVFSEWRDPTPPAPFRFVQATFQAISASTTTGFNSVPIGTMSATGLWLVTLLMFIGAGPGGTAGGIKNTTFGVMVAHLFSYLRGQQQTTIFGREVPARTISSALLVTVGAALWVSLVLLAMTLTESVPFLPLLFEVVSAFGTVGLSTGITAALSMTGKLLIILTMFFGRVGPIAFGMSLLRQPQPVSIRHAEADIIIG
ncbi:Trk family potassium uptake protein [candidate division WOR-3 bacterium]|nr:Trk family potassium uptake protein [candidate division WOR-3 bacterium]